MQLQLIDTPLDVAADKHKPVIEWMGLNVYFINKASASSNTSWLVARTVKRVQLIERVITKGNSTKTVQHNPILDLADRHGYIMPMELKPTKPMITRSEALERIDEIMAGAYAGRENAQRYIDIRNEIASAKAPVVWS